MKNNKGIASILIIIIAVGVLVAGGYYFWSKNTQKQVACTEEAKVCPNGSSVGRTGPNCEFAACPGGETANGKSIVVDGKLTNISILVISLPLDEEEAFSIAKNLCNKEEQNDEKYQAGGFYGYTAELNNSWFINIKVVNCVCGVLINKETGETNCFYNVPSDKLDQIKY